MPFDETRGTRKTEEDDKEVGGKKGRKYKILLGFIMQTVSRPSETERKVYVPYELNCPTFKYFLKTSAL